MQRPLTRVLATAPFEALDAGDGGALIVDHDGLGPKDAEITVRVSKDRGKTWGPEKIRSLGAFGQYDKLVRLHALGGGYRATVEFTMTEPAEISIESTALLEVA